MNGRMDGQIEGRTNGRTDGRWNGHRNGHTNGHRNGRRDELKRTDRRTDGRIDGGTAREAYEGTDGDVYVRTDICELVACDLNDVNVIFTQIFSRKKNITVH